MDRRRCLQSPRSSEGKGHWNVVAAFSGWSPTFLCGETSCHLARRRWGWGYAWRTPPADGWSPCEARRSAGRCLAGGSAGLFPWVSGRSEEQWEEWHHFWPSNRGGVNNTDRQTLIKTKHFMGNDEKLIQLSSFGHLSYSEAAHWFKYGIFWVAGVLVFCMLLSYHVQDILGTLCDTISEYGIYSRVNHSHWFCSSTIELYFIDGIHHANISWEIRWLMW